MNKIETAEIPVDDLEDLIRAALDIERHRNIVNLSEEQRQALISALTSATMPVALKLGAELGRTEKETKEHFGVYL